MTFKTLFGTVPVLRRRIANRADESLEIPAARAWGTPQQVTITPGLRDAICDALAGESSRKSLQQVEQRAGEPGLLGRGMVWTREGVVALDVLESTRRNGKLCFWRVHRDLPALVSTALMNQAA
jgi:hypothetical protein